MTLSHTWIPHALGAAHSELIAAIDSGNQQVCRCIERFVDAISQITGGRDELRRRATLVETRCGPASDYDTTRTQSLLGYRGRPSKLTGSRLAIESLSTSARTPLFLAEVEQERQQIERVLNEGILNLSTATRQAFEGWRSACRAVQREAEPMEVDGCWYLLHVHEAGEDITSDRANVAKAVTQTAMGGANLDSVRAAVVSLVDWAHNAYLKPIVEKPTGNVAPAATATPKRRGRPKADYETEQEEAQLATDWKRAKDSGVYKPDFAKQSGMTAAKLDTLLNRVAKRKSRSEK